MIDLVFELLLILMFAVITASTSFTVRQFMRPGMILHFWWLFLDGKRDAWWHKPAGYCEVCFNIWLCVLAYPFWLLWLGLIGEWQLWLFLFAVCSISNVLLRMLMVYLYRIPDELKTIRELLWEIKILTHKLTKQIHDALTDPPNPEQ